MLSFPSLFQIINLKSLVRRKFIEGGKIINLALAILFLFSNLSAEVPDTLWTKTYGGDNWECGNSVQQISDGGFIIAGETMSFGAGTWDVYLIRTNSDGDTLWTKTYGGDSVDCGNSVQQTSDGGFVIVGCTNSFGGDFQVYLIRTNLNGDTLWTRTYGGPMSDQGNSVQQTSDGGFVIVGYTNSFGAGEADIYLIRTNSDGDTLWTKTYGGIYVDNGTSIQEIGENRFFIAGSRDYDFPTHCRDLYLMLISSNGDTIWTKTYSTFYHYWNQQFSQTSDSGFIITGLSLYEDLQWDYYDIYLVRTDNNGDTIWTQRYVVPGDEFGCSVYQTNDGGFFISGHASLLGEVERDIYLVRTDLNGNTLWTKTYGGDSTDYAESMVQTSDGGFIIVGRTNSFGAGKFDVYLIRLDKEITGIQEEIAPFSLKTNDFIVSYNNGDISIRYTILYSTTVKLEAYDIQGKLVKVITDKFMQEGSYSVKWDSQGYGSGVYFLKLSINGSAVSRKVTIVR